MHMYSSWNFCILVLSQILRCNLHKYILNREPREFEFTRFLVDGSHWVGKSDPCNRILQWSGAFIEISQYSTCSEDTRRWKRPVHQVEGVISVAVKVNFTSSIWTSRAVMQLDVSHQSISWITEVRKIWHSGYNYNQYKAVIGDGFSQVLA